MAKIYDLNEGLIRRFPSFELHKIFLSGVFRNDEREELQFFRNGIEIAVLPYWYIRLSGRRGIEKWATYWKWPLSLLWKR